MEKEKWENEKRRKRKGRRKKRIVKKRNKKGLKYEGHLKKSNFYSVRKVIARRYPRGVMVKAMDCGIVVREFVFQSRYYVHFRANTLGKGMNPVILPAMG